MSIPFQVRWIVGKTIAAVRLNRYATGRGRYTMGPVIVFTDGSEIRFETRETAHEDGTDISYRKPPKVPSTRGPGRPPHG